MVNTNAGQIKSVGNMDILDFEIARYLPIIGMAAVTDTKCFANYQPLLADTDLKSPLNKTTSDYFRDQNFVNTAYSNDTEVRTRR